MRWWHFDIVTLCKGCRSFQNIVICHQFDLTHTVCTALKWKGKTCHTAYTSTNIIVWFKQLAYLASFEHCCFAHLQRHLHCGGQPPVPPAPPSSTRRRQSRTRRPPRGATRGATKGAPGGAITANWEDVRAWAGPFMPPSPPLSLHSDENAFSISQLFTYGPLSQEGDPIVTVPCWGSLGVRGELQSNCHQITLTSFHFLLWKFKKWIIFHLLWVREMFFPSAILWASEGWRFWAD